MRVGKKLAAGDPDTDELLRDVWLEFVQVAQPDLESGFLRDNTEEAADQVAAFADALLERFCARFVEVKQS